MANNRRKLKSTNPFDDSFDSDENDDSDEFFDAQDEHPDDGRQRRSAALDFENPFDKGEAPALQFNKPQSPTYKFVSPLENALLHSTPSPDKSTTQNSDDDNEDINLERTPLVPNGKSGRNYTDDDGSRTPGRNGVPTEVRTQPSTSRRRSSTKSQAKDRVLKELADGDMDVVDYKFLLLEDFGTAASWVTLLLPYIAFVLCLLMESSKSFRVSTTGPLNATTPCLNGETNTNQPFLQAPPMPCYFPFSLDANQFHTSTRQQQYTSNSRTAGIAFESGIIPGVPVMSTFLRGDAEFDRLSTEQVALVAKGELEATVTVLQEENNDWSVVYTSPPRQVSMVCDTSNATSHLEWNCRSPRILDVVYSMPEAGVYAGGEMRVNILYSYKKQLTSAANDDNIDLQVDQSDVSFVFTGIEGASSLFASTVISKPALRVEEIVSHSSITLEHMNHRAMEIDTFVRISTFLITAAFSIFWLHSMGLFEILCRCCVGVVPCLPMPKRAIMWWQSPWILFPERRYIVILLISLLFMQDPVLPLMYFFPSLGSSARLHVTADALMGIGVNCTLFVYLCLFHSFRFHTASVTRKRAEHQRKYFQLRHAAKYVIDGDSLDKEENEEAINEYITDYYDRHGNTDGTAYPRHLRLESDPFSSNWADFLFGKLLLLFLGIASVIVTAYCRFPPGIKDVTETSETTINHYKTAYVASIVTQFFSSLIWIFLIIHAALESGRKLRAEPFLSTRPAQLAYRVLFAHITLGFTALAVSFSLSIYRLLQKWLLQGRNATFHSPTALGVDQTSNLEVILRVLTQVARQFPYSGTAASIGSGRILFATVSILITAFIFLPAHILDDEIDDPEKKLLLGKMGAIQEKVVEKRRLRRDKRLVVHLARDTRTWRVFPLAIKQTVESSTLLQEKGFQIYGSLRTQSNNVKERGVVSIGPYTPVFCLELACWLNEASWQAYYTPEALSNDKTYSSDKMNLESIGLRLEGAVRDEATGTQSYVATNIAPQVDGEEDSIIVVAFRGTANAVNVKTDFRARQVALLDQLSGAGSSPFRIYPDRLEIYDSDGWIWDTPNLRTTSDLSTFVTPSQGCLPYHYKRSKSTPFDTVKQGAEAILKATPVAKDTFPCVHEGFQDVYTLIRRRVLDILLPVLQRQFAKALERANGNDDEPLALPKIYCTGHSLGGALAQFLGLDLANNCELFLKVNSNSSDLFPEDQVFNLPTPSSMASKSWSFDSNLDPDEAPEELRLQPPIAVYSYGQPRVGNKPFSRFYKQRVPHTFRVVNEGDAITSMPNFVFCRGTYKHAGLEVLLDEGLTGNILVGPTVVETMFRFHEMRTNMVAHTMARYRDCLECAFEQHELTAYYQGHSGVQSDSHKSDPSTAIPDWMTQVRQSHR